MTVAELIKQLQKHPELQEIEVEVSGGDRPLVIDIVTCIKTPYKAVTIYTCEPEPEDDES